MIRDDDDYENEFPEFEEESEFEEDEYDDFDDDDDLDDDMELESAGVLDGITDLIVGDAELEFDLDDDDLDDDDVEEERRRRRSRRSRKSKRGSRRKYRSKRKSKSRSRRKLSSRVSRGLSGYKRKYAARKAKKTMKSSFWPSGSGGMKRLLVKLTIIGVVIGFIFMALQATPLAPVVNKVNSAATNAVSKVVGGAKKGRF